MSLSLSFLWHMHQPDYRDASGQMGMPWVFLHALKDYYDMPWLLEAHPKLKATFNLTPPLIEQLQRYKTEGAGADRFLSFWRREPDELSVPERDEVMRLCNSARFDTMVKPLPRFAELYGREGLNEREFRDLECCFLLSWCGNYLREHNETVGSLLRKGRDYTAGDKATLLKSLLAFVSTILPYYRTLWEAGKIELSTTPLNHPILPLLMDMENARRSNPATQIPENHFSLADDAREQVEQALALFTKVFGRRPRGVWPAEGAVDASTLGLYRKAGLEWVATDEAILFASLGENDRKSLYESWEFSGVRIAFREHPLSDKIGFTYQHWAADRAAEDFTAALKAIEKEYPDATVSVILDGENAWEFYPQNALPFFRALYHGLEAEESFRCITLSETLEHPAKPLNKLHPGSWIYGTFDTWVGHPEKNAAWELLYQTRRDYSHHEAGLPAAAKAECLEHFLAAECSDWFWWYGEDHYTDFSREFDILFRAHLIAVYESMGMHPPANLFRPIAGKGGSHALLVESKFPIHPHIDGRVSSFFEWLGSGMSDEAHLYSTMDGEKRGPVSRLYWGQDEQRLYLRMDGALRSLSDGGWLKIFAGEKRWSIPLDDPAKAPEGIHWALDEILELAMEKRLFSDAKSVNLRIELGKGSELLQILPGAGELRIDLEKEFAKCWFV